MARRKRRRRRVRAVLDGVRGLPIPLSVDNVVAGTGLGLLGFSPWLSAAIFGVITAVMSMVGLVLDRTAFRLIRSRINIRYEVVTSTGPCPGALMSRGGPVLRVTARFCPRC